MKKELDIIVSAAIANDPILLEQWIVEKLGVQYKRFRIEKRSIDARQKDIKFNLRILAFSSDEGVEPRIDKRVFQNVLNAKSVVIIGAGPTGLFAALKLIECGIKPIIIERGKDVQARRRDIAAIHKQSIVNPNSNYCFGEGGAGAYSDGKLYTRSTKRGDVRSVLETLVQFGADENILVEAHPHIGTNKLPKIIATLRNQIIDCGGEVHFNAKLTDINFTNNLVTEVTTSNGINLKAEAFVLATGHSARDVFELLERKKIPIEFKAFALGVRVEHPQKLVDWAQYKCEVRPDFLPPASYSLVHQTTHGSVYSFCMCPGGIIAPCATESNEIVTNGWSPSKRNNQWANSGIVVPVAWDDIPQHQHGGALAAMYFQKEIEHKCWQAAGETQAAPAQRMIDFVNNKVSTSLPKSSYQPGIISCNLNEILPPFIAENLREGFKAFGKKMKGYYTNDAVLVAPESRTSSPVRIPRDKENLHHPQLTNFYPCGEGAGYAGGIVSAAIDGEKVAASIASKMFN